MHTNTYTEVIRAATKLLINELLLEKEQKNDKLLGKLCFYPVYAEKEKNKKAQVPNKLREKNGEIFMWKDILKQDTETFQTKAKELYDLANQLKGQIPQEGQNEWENNIVNPLKQIIMRFEGGFARLNFEESNA